MLNIVLFGPPGAGKGTQSKFIVENFQLIHVSTGDLFRQNIANKTELGTLAKSYTDAGNLVPDKVVVDMITRKIQENKQAKGFIFDGFPRTIPQAIALDQMLEENDLSITCTIALMVEDHELNARLLNRGKIEGRHDDQDENKIKHRLSVYHQETVPILDFYKKQNKLYPIDGKGSVENIAQEISTSIRALII